jgi:hypothetical protein
MQAFSEKYSKIFSIDTLNGLLYWYSVYAIDCDKNCFGQILGALISLQFRNVCKKAFAFMENMLKYDFMKYRNRLLYYRFAPIYTRYTLYTNLLGRLKSAMEPKNE